MVTDTTGVASGWLDWELFILWVFCRTNSYKENKKTERNIKVSENSVSVFSYDSKRIIPEHQIYFYLFYGRDNQPLGGSAAL